MRLLIPALFLIAGCDSSYDAPKRPSIIDVTGRIEYRSLDETSGLARSLRDPGLLWAINDDGPARLYGIGIDGSRRGRVDIRGARNRDWEELASFELDGRPYLLIADTGDNLARRRNVTMIVVEEPGPGDEETDIAWAFDFSFPGGPRDAEAVAVDVDTRQILVISKRDIPARLYALPLRPGPDERVTAEFLGVVDSLPQPNRNDINRATLTDRWHWQPTAMSISTDGRQAMILTYGSIYLYARSESEAWPYAFRRMPLGLSLGRLPDAESVTLSADGQFAFITTEGRRPPLVRVDLRRKKTDEKSN